MNTKFLQLLMAGTGLLLTFSSFKYPEDKLIVHEWGTFTTLHGSDGKQLSGLYIEEEHLPSFVYSHSRLANDISDLTVDKGRPFSIQPLNVTLKMETPVLYFYSDKSRKISVHVDFPNGSISQWYPKRSKGDTIPAGETLVNFKNPYNGWIEWNNVEILEPNLKVSFTPSKKEETKTWITPRNTDANKIMVDTEIERFLFYRGLGNLSVPLSIKFDDDKTLSIKNASQSNMPFLFVYEKKENNNINVWWNGKLSIDEEKTVSISQKSALSTADAFKSFEKALTDAGLFEKEAKAMLDTWEESYFKKPGFRIFWILPEEMTNTLLPLRMNPNPTEIKRVFVGRCDILTPEFERTLIKEYKKNNLADYKNHRYTLGFAERVKALIKE